MTYIEDITEKRRVEDLARRSEERYRRLVENLPRRYLDLRRQRSQHAHQFPTSRLFAVTRLREICVREPDLWSRLIHPDDVAGVDDLLHALFERAQPFDAEYRMRHKDGRWIWVHDRATRTFKEDGCTYADGGAVGDYLAQARGRGAARKRGRATARCLRTCTPGWPAAGCCLRTASRATTSTRR